MEEEDMKTTNDFSFKKYRYSLFGGLLWLLITVNAFASDDSSPAQNDTLTYQEFSGRLVDAESGDPVIFASVFLEETNIGTVSNSEGDFMIKIPKDMRDKQLCFTHLGYSLTKVSLNAFTKDTDLTIELYPAARSIQEVTIRTEDPKQLIQMAIDNIGENYPEKVRIDRGFYRETIKENWHYVAILEAVVDIYNVGYDKSFQYDRVKIYKGRKSRDVKRMDTVLFKLQGGPTTALMLDVAKNPHNLFSNENMEGYNYELEGIVTINDREAYSIRFEPKKSEEYDYLVYEGNVYLDFETLAISGMEFQLSPSGLDEASQFLVRRKPFGMEVEVEGANYFTTYREIDGKWYLNYVRSENTFKCKWDNRLFNSTYRTMSEMAVTDRNIETPEKFNRKEVFKSNQALVDEIDYFYDDDFWGEDNTIRPDDNIDAAIRKLNRRLK